MKKSVLLVFMLFVLFSISAAFNAQESDYRFYNQANYEEDKKILEEALNSAESEDEKYEILWRLSRDQLTITDQLADSLTKKEKIERYSLAEEYADRALEIKQGAAGYHWKSSAIGRIGQANGPMNSLKKAEPMKALILKVVDDFQADSSDSWYVLGILYNQLPGNPISFGNDNFAISYMRRCLDTQDNENRSNLTNYLELAQQLWERQWTKKKRAKEFEKMKAAYAAQTINSEKMKYYEGVMGQPFYLDVPITSINDKQEAIKILEYGLENFEKRAVKLPDDIKKAELCRETLTTMKDEI